MKSSQQNDDVIEALDSHPRDPGSNPTEGNFSFGVFECGFQSFWEIIKWMWTDSTYQHLRKHLSSQCPGFKSHRRKLLFQCLGVGLSCKCQVYLSKSPVNYRPNWTRRWQACIIPESRVQIPPRELFLRCFFLVRFSIIFGNYQVLQPGIAAKHD